MDKGYEKEKFIGLKIKSPVAKKFRRFCKRLSKSQSMTLLSMLDFFEVNGVSPEDRLGETITGLKNQIRRRFNAMIAIIRDIEKGQTKPTVAMLQSLFEQHLQEDQDDDDEDTFEFIEHKFTEGKPEEEWLEKTTVPRIRYDRLEEKLSSLKADFSYVLDKVKEVKTPFGNNYLKLELSKEEVEKYKRTLKNI